MSASLLVAYALGRIALAVAVSSLIVGFAVAQAVRVGWEILLDGWLPIERRWNEIQGS